MPETLTIERFDEHPIWGACVFFTAQVDDAEAVRDAYAEAAASLPPLHFAVAEALPEALDPWYRLGFAQMHAYAARASGGEHFEVPGVTLRPGTVDDLETAMRIDRLIYDTQAAAPSFSPHAPASRSIGRAGARRSRRTTSPTGSPSATGGRSATSPSIPTRPRTMRCTSPRRRSSRRTAEPASAGC